MDKSLLLVLLCLQVFLLITTFTSTDAAALVEDGFLKLSPELERTAEKETKLRLWLLCWVRPEDCDITPPPPIKTPRLGCGKRQGGCSSLRAPPRGVLKKLQSSST